MNRDVQNHLGVLIRRLVEHDENTIKRQDARTELIGQIMLALKGMGYHPCPEIDPLEFRCGDIIVTIADQRNVRWRTIKSLQPRDDDR